MYFEKVIGRQVTRWPVSQASRGPKHAHWTWVGKGSWDDPKEGGQVSCGAEEEFQGDPLEQLAGRRWHP